MKRASFAAVLPMLLMLVTVPAPAGPKPEPRAPFTRWEIRSAPGLDALLIIGIVSGDELQQRAYAGRLPQLQALFSDETRPAIGQLGEQVRQLGLLLGPALVLIGSGGPFSSLEETIASFEQPARLRHSLERTPYWDAESWQVFQSAVPTVLRALRELQRGGYVAWYEERILPDIEQGIAAVAAATEGVNLIAEQERLLGRSLDPTIEVLLVEFSKPYGIKVQGQRFLNWWGYETTNPLRTAAHEIFHPPVDFRQDRVSAAVRRLASDPLIQAILQYHDPKYGYNSLQGIVDEDAAQALDQAVSERLGFAREPAERWRRADGGMHLLAAAIYDAMNETGFIRNGGHFQSWLVAALNEGMLNGPELQRRAARIVGKPAVRGWLDHPENR